MNNEPNFQDQKAGVPEGPQHGAQSGNTNDTDGKQPKNKTLMIVLASVIGVALIGGAFGGGYAVGHSTANSKSSNSRRSFDSMSQNGSSNYGPDGRGGTRTDGNMGTVIKISDSSITISTRAGSDATFKITNDTKVTKSGSTIKASDIAKDDRVVITTSDSDDATASQIRVVVMRGLNNNSSNSSSDSSSSGSN